MELTVSQIKVQLLYRQRRKERGISGLLKDIFEKRLTEFGNQFNWEDRGIEGHIKNDFLGSSNSSSGYLSKEKH